MNNNEFDDITNKINQHILESIKVLSERRTDPYYDLKKDFEVATNYKDLFHVVTTSKPMDYVVYTFIEKLIKLNIKNGYLTRSYTNELGKECTTKIPLSQLESVTYIYDSTFGDNQIIRMHQYKSKKKEYSEPIFGPYTMSNVGIDLCGNYNKDNINKYCIKPEI